MQVDETVSIGASRFPDDAHDSDVIAVTFCRANRAKSDLISVISHEIAHISDVLTIQDFGSRIALGQLVNFPHTQGSTHFGLNRLVKGKPPETVGRKATGLNPNPGHGSRVAERPSQSLRGAWGDRKAQSKA